MKDASAGISVTLCWGLHQLYLHITSRLQPLVKPEEVLRMNPPCARCGKIVYPTEKVSCLDKVSTLETK